MPAGSSGNLLPFALQNSLQRAHPSPLPSNTVVTIVVGPYANTAVGDAVVVTYRKQSAMVWGGPGVSPGWVWGGGQWK